MTAEIAVLNKEAVALAADSAVTIDTTGGPKIFNSVSKIFGLSRQHPIGVMVYGNSSLLGVPWETVIKSFRETLEESNLPHLEDYGDRLASFIEANRSFFPRDAQSEWAAATVRSYYKYLERRVLAEVRARLKANGKVSRGEIKSILTDEVRAHHRQWKDAPDLPGSLGGRTADVTKKLAKRFAETRRSVFSRAPLAPGTARQLGELAAWLFTKAPPPNRRHPGRSGLVLAGFGADDVFPRLRRFEVYGVLLDRLAYVEGEPIHIDRENNASIAPFAQREMVTAFMEGVHPKVKRAVADQIQSLVRDHPQAVIDTADLSEADKVKLKKLFRNNEQKRAREAYDEIQEHRISEHVAPVLDVVAVLPKDELAAMAESLVNLTSFRRRVSLAAETVGGPIDVAVISKGDGFIWISHKHYFKRELNPHFYANRYGGAHG